MANTKDKAVPSAKPNDVGVDPANTTDFTSDDAAVVIQRAWRARRNTVLNSDARWGDVAIHARLQVNALNSRFRINIVLSHEVANYM